MFDLKELYTTPIKFCMSYTSEESIKRHDVINLWQPNYFR